MSESHPTTEPTGAQAQIAEPGAAEPGAAQPGAAQPGAAQPVIEPWLREILRCPRCRGVLRDAAGETAAELQCPACSLGYPVEAGVPVLLVDLARPLGR